MSIMNVPFAKPYIGQEEIEEVVAVLKSGWLTTGSRCKQFETDFAAFMGDDVEAIAVNSCTAGLHLALEAIGITAGDEVIVPVHTFTATAEVIRYLGADPVFVDVDAVTLCMDPEKFKAAITPKTKAVMPVHYAGRSCDMDAILEIAQKHNIKVVEDAAHALPTKYKGKLIGTLDSDITVFSFYANKTITTGEGGMIVTRNAEIAKRCRTMRTHGMNKDAFDRFTSTSKKPAWHYQIVAPGYKYNLPDLSAAVGIHQLKRAYDMQESRREISLKYIDLLEGLPLTPMQDTDSDNLHSWHLFVVQLDLDRLTITRDQFIELLTATGVGTSVHYIPLHMHPYWKETYNLQDDMFPVSTAAFHRLVSLPLYPYMAAQAIEKVVSEVRSICNTHARKIAV